jgi:hypothetical protein
MEIATRRVRIIPLCGVPTVDTQMLVGAELHGDRLRVAIQVVESTVAGLVRAATAALDIDPFASKEPIRLRRQRLLHATPRKER